MARPSPQYLPGSAEFANLIEDLGAEVAARYARAEEELVRLVAKYVRRGIDTPPDLIERLAVIRALEAESRLIAKDLNTEELARRVVAVASEQGQAAAVRQIGLAGIPSTFSGGAAGITANSASAVSTLALDLTNRLEDMDRRITRWAPDIYQRVISANAPNVLLGATTIQETQRRAAQDLIGRGVTGFVDKAGKNWRIGTYAEMATRTSVNRAFQASNQDRLTLNGIHLVQIIIGNNACAACAAHAGKIYSTDGTPAGVYTLPHATEDGTVQVVVAGTLDQARAAGWNHPNCRCVTVGYFPGLPMSSDATTYDPQAERDRDRMREIEREIRDHKRKEAAAMDDITAARERAKVREWQAKAREHVANSPTTLRKPYREQLGFSDGTRPDSTPPGPKAIEPPGPRALTP